jgi:hypothetical protein
MLRHWCCIGIEFSSLYVHRSLEYEIEFNPDTPPMKVCDQKFPDIRCVGLPISPIYHHK